jgi:hypothetical protein
MYQSRDTAKNSWWWAERLPETCRVVIPLKLEFSASVGFIHKELQVYLPIGFLKLRPYKLRIYYRSNFDEPVSMWVKWLNDRPGNRGVVVRFPVWDIFIFSNAFRASLESIQPSLQWVPGALSPGIRRPGIKLTTHLSGVEVQNKRSYTSSPPYFFVAFTG